MSFAAFARTIQTYSSPNFAVNPSNPEVIVGAFAELRTRRCGLIRTTNGGERWSVIDPAQSSPSPSSYPNCNSNPRDTFQAQPAFGRDDAASGPGRRHRPC